MKAPRRTALSLLVVVATGSWLVCRRDPARGQPRTPVAAPARNARPSPRVAVTEAPLDAGAPVARTCPPDMVLAEGERCVNADQRCIRWLDEVTQLQCAEFERPRCTGRRRHMAVCIDRYEYPNQAGVLPMVMVSWYEARRRCQAQNKRLCTESEWTFSCEGPTAQPYPYGLRRDRHICRIDHQPFGPNFARLHDPTTVVDESAHLYSALPSGVQPQCVSWAGVYDMTGNVDEWVVNEDGVPFNSSLKGGWWGPIRARCRPSTTAHKESFVYYQIGFRCCADPDPPYRPSSTTAGAIDGGSHVR
jgi:hypothetical protein